MKFVRFVLALGIATASVIPEAAGGEDAAAGIRNIHGEKLADLREAILPMVEESLQASFAIESNWYIPYSRREKLVTTLV